MKTQPVSSDYILYSTYPVYVQEYNDLLVHVYKLCGKEAQEQFPHIDLGKYMNPADTLYQPAFTGISLTWVVSHRSLLEHCHSERRLVLEAVCKDRFDPLRKGFHTVFLVFGKCACRAPSGHFTHSLLGTFWKQYLDLAVVKLNTLAAYLQSKIPAVRKEIEAVMDFITANLRPSIFEDPKNERALQNIVEVMLRAREYEYRRELIRIPYSSKVYIPDFTFEVLHLALEMKLCNSRERVKEMIDEINGDIPPYQIRYENVIFAIYDLGYIRDVAEFKGSIERNLNVYVTVIKK